MDLGYHWDLLETSFKRRVYTNDAIRIAQFANGLNDLIGNLLSNDFASGLIEGLDEGAFKHWLKNLQHARLLHADNLFAAGDAKRYFQQLMANIVTETENIEKGFDTADLEIQQERSEQLLVLIGIATHACQDFCSHSTWVGQLQNAKRLNGRVTRYQVKIRKQSPCSRNRLVRVLHKVARLEGG